MSTVSYDDVNMGLNAVFLHRVQGDSQHHRDYVTLQLWPPTLRPIWGCFVWNLQRQSSVFRFSSSNFRPSSSNFPTLYFRSSTPNFLPNTSDLRLQISFFILQIFGLIFPSPYFRSSILNFLLQSLTLNFFFKLLMEIWCDKSSA